MASPPRFDDWFARARAMPENEGVRDTELAQLYLDSYSASAFRTDDAPAEEKGDFARGFAQTWPQAKQLIGGTLFAIGDSIGFDALADYGKNVFLENQKAVEELSRDTDSATRNWEEGTAGDWIDFLQYAAGYTIGQAVQAGAAGMAGAAIGSMTGGPAGTVAGAAGGALGKGLVTEGIKKYAQKKIGELVAKDVAQDVAEKMVAKQIGAMIGAAGTLGAYNISQEVGQTYPEMMQQKEEAGEEVTAGDRLRAWGGGVAAAIVESGADMIGGGKILGNMLKSAPGDKLGMRMLKEVPTAIGREAGTEAVQTGLERWGAQQEVFSPEGVRDIIDSSALGAVGGGLAGGAASIRRVKETATKIDTAGTEDAARAALTAHILGDTEKDAILGPTGASPQGLLGEPTQLGFDSPEGFQPALTATPEGIRPMRKQDAVGMVPEAVANLRTETPQGAAELATALNTPTEVTADTQPAPYQSTMTPEGTFAVEPTVPAVAASEVALFVQDSRAKIERTLALGKDTGGMTTFNAELAPHEAVKGGSMAVGLGKLFGINVYFYRQTAGERTINGGVSADPGTRSLFINMQAASPVMQVFGHELSHWMERDDPTGYQQFLDEVKVFMPAEELKRIEEKYGGLGKAVKEGAADLSGLVWTNDSFWAKLSKAKPNVFTRVAAAVRRFIEQIKARLSEGTTPITKQVVAEIDKLEAIVAKYTVRHQEIAAKNEALRTRGPTPMANLSGQQVGPAAAQEAAAESTREQTRAREQEAAQESVDQTSERLGEGLARGEGVNLKPEDYAGPQLALTGRSLTPDEREAIRREGRSPEAIAARAEARRRQEEAIAKHHSQTQPRDETGKFSLPENAVQKEPVSTVAEQPAETEQISDRTATADDFSKENIEGIVRLNGWAILTAENPNNTEASDEENIRRTNELRRRLRDDGLKYIEVRGRYSEVDRPEERSFIVFADKRQAMALGMEFNQESILTREGLVYQNGGLDKATGKVDVFDEIPPNYYTRIPGENWAFAVDIAFSIADEEEADPDGIDRSVLIRAAKRIEAETRYANIREQTPQNMRTVVRRLKKDVLRELRRDRNAAEWYRDDLNKALDTVASVYPEVATNPESRQAFIAALAITSNGTTIAQNVFAAFDLYTEYRKDPSQGLPIRGTGVRRVNMERALSTFNELVDVLGADDAATFLATPFRAGDLKEMVGISGWPVDYEVYGSAVFGPKIGHGFFSNLSGRYDALTMDRWFFRTWGRVTGNLLRPANRVNKKTGEIITEVLMETQVSSKDRAFAHDAIAELTQELVKEGYNGLTVAGVQAILWYHEKALFESHGAVNEKAKPTSYSREVESFIREHGLQPVQRGGRDAAVAGSVEGERAAAEVPWEEQGAALADAPFSLADAGLAEPAVRPGREGSVSAVGIHFGQQPNLPALSGNRFGTGIRGAEQERLRGADPRIQRRVYFYLHNPQSQFNVKRREYGLGVHAYRAQLGNLYEPGVSPNIPRTPVESYPGIVDQGETSNRWELAVLDAGYDGYLIRNPDIAVVLNKDVPVEYLGALGQGEISFSLAATPFEQDMAAQATFLTEYAKSAGYVDLDDMLAKDPMRFMEVAKRWRTYNPLVTAEVPPPTSSDAFKLWFRNGVVADKNGNPLTVYHSTMAWTGPFEGGVELDFEVFNTKGSELGSHFGTTEQANAFGSNQYRRIIPGYINLQSPLRLQDFGSFDWNGAAWQLEFLGLLTEDQVEEGYKLSIPDQNAVMQSVIREAGYDGVVYLNRREGLEGADESHNDYSDEQFKLIFPKAEDSYIIFDPRQFKSKFNRGDFNPINPSMSFSIDHIDMSDFALPEERPSMQQAIAEDIKNFGTTMAETDYTELGRLWLELAANPALFSYPFSFDDSLENVAYDMSGTEVKVASRPASAQDKQYYSGTGFTPRRTHTLTFKHAELGDMKADVYEDNDGRLALNVADFKQGQTLGSLIYQIVGTWAYNSGKTFIGDPAGLSNRALFRRTANMLSNALRTGSTDHLAPHVLQTDAGLKWRKGDELYNIGAMATWLHDTLAFYAPENYANAVGKDAATRDGELGAEGPRAPVNTITASGGARTQGAVAITRQLLDEVVGLERGQAGRGARVRAPLHTVDSLRRGVVGTGVLYSLAEDVPFKRGGAVTSALLQQFSMISTTSAPAEGWLGVLNGMINKGQVKEEEVFWSGLRDFIESQREFHAAGFRKEKAITKGEIVGFLTSNGLRIREDARTSAERHWGDTGMDASELADMWGYYVDDATEVEKAKHAMRQYHQALEQWKSATIRDMQRFYRGLPNDKEQAKWKAKGLAFGEYLRHIADSIRYTTGEDPALMTDDAQEYVHQAQKLTRTPFPQFDDYNSDEEMYVIRNGDDTHTDPHTHPDAAWEQLFESNTLDDLANMAGQSEQDDDSDTQYKDYKLEGGSEYTELLFKGSPKVTATTEWVVTETDVDGVDQHYTFTDRDSAIAHAKELRGYTNVKITMVRTNGSRFVPGHFQDAENTLAHVRFTTRVTPDEKVVLFLEELQSDWSQAGRDRGFKKPRVNRPLVDTLPDFIELVKSREVIDDTTLQNKMDVERARVMDILTKLLEEDHENDIDRFNDAYPGIKEFDEIDQYVMLWLTNTSGRPSQELIDRYLDIVRQIIPDAFPDGLPEFIGTDLRTVYTVRDNSEGYNIKRLYVPVEMTEAEGLEWAKNEAIYVYRRELQNDYDNNQRDTPPPAPFVATRKYGVRMEDGSELKNEKGQVVRFKSMKEAEAAAKKSGGTAFDLGFVHDTPGWVTLILKHMIIKAVEDGFGYIAWATGTQNADFYGLQHRLESISFAPAPDPEFTEVKMRRIDGGDINFTVNNSNGKVTRSSLYHSIGKTMEELVGKELATRIVGKKGRVTHEGLKVGGEGMTRFYDEMLPSIVNNLIKKYDSKVEPIRVGDSVHRAPVPKKFKGRWYIKDTRTGMFAKSSRVPREDGLGYDITSEWVQSGEDAISFAKKKDADTWIRGLALPRRDDQPGMQLGFKVSEKMKREVQDNGFTLFSLADEQFDSYVKRENAVIRQQKVLGKKALFTAISRVAAAVSDLQRFSKDGIEVQIPLPMGPSPHTLQMLGAPGQVLRIDPDVLRKVFFEKHAKEFDGVNPIQLMRGIYEPLAVFVPQDGDGEWEVVTGVTNSAGDVVTAIIKQDTSPIPRGALSASIKSIYTTGWTKGQTNVGYRAKTRAVPYVDRMAVKAKVQDPGLRQMLLSKNALDKKDVTVWIASNFRGAKDDMPPFSIADDREYTPEQEAAFKRVGRTVIRPSWKDRVAELRKDFWKKMAQGLVDQFAPLKELSTKAYTLARLSKGAPGAIEAFLRHGKLSMTDGVYDADTSGGFLQRVAIPLRGEMDDFLWWIAANRAERLSKEDRERLFTPEDIGQLKALATGESKFDYVLQHGPRRGETTRSRRLIYADALISFNEFNKNALDMAEQSGLIDGESRAHWENEFYVPFYRVAEEEGRIGVLTKNGLVRQKAFKALKGGTDKLNQDLLANVLQNWSHLIEAGSKNRAAVSSALAAVDAGIAIEADEATVRSMGRSLHKRKDVFFVMDGGRERYFIVDDPAVMAAMSSLEYAGLRGPLMDALSSFKHWLTVGVTASPAFKVRNLIRDSLQAVALSELSPNPVANVIEGFKAGRHESQDYVSALASGGLIRFGTMLESDQSRRVRQLVKMGVKDATILDNEDKLQRLYDRYIEPAIVAYNELGNRGEEINRMALFKQLRSQGVDQGTAALMARDLLDFSMQGTFTSVRFLTQIVPFMNARMQGLYKLGRGARDNPQRFAAVLGATALTSLALLAMFHDDDEWKKREEWDRDNFWWFKFAGVAFRIPKPFEIGAMATLAERGAELFFDKEMTGGRFSKVVLGLVANNLSMNPIPQAVKPILDVYANKDSFTGRPIETMGMERLQADYRFTQGTSMLARGLSTGVNEALRGIGLDKAGVSFLSPLQIDHMVRGYFAWLGTFIVSGVDTMVRPMTDAPSRAAPDYWKMASFGFAQEVPASHSRYVSQMYDQANVVSEAYATYRNLLNTGRKEEAAQFRAENKEEIDAYKRINKAQQAMSKMSQQIRIIENSNLSPSEKRRRIDEIRQRQDDRARRVSLI